MDIFNIIGPVMIGPSSSHTAGALKIGMVARQLLGEPPIKASIKLYGSFSSTYKGHGTDKAVVAGILGIPCDDDRVKNSLELARDAILDCTIEPTDEESEHPNTIDLRLTSATGKSISLRGQSTGGGNIRIVEYNGLAVSFTGQSDTLVIFHRDVPGMIASVSNLLANQRINIATMNVFRSARGEHAVMIIEVDQSIPNTLAKEIRALSQISDVTYIQPI